jgi:hypothetical protein
MNVLAWHVCELLHLPNLLEDSFWHVCELLHFQTFSNTGSGMFVNYYIFWTLSMTSGMFVNYHIFQTFSRTASEIVFLAKLGVSTST